MSIRNLFKKKKVKVNPTGWYSVSLEQFNKLKKLDLNTFEDQISAAEVLLNTDPDMKWSDFVKEVERLNFLDQPIPEVIIRKEYTLNGRVYECRPNLNELSVSQYMDFVELSKTGDLEKILAIVIIPKGKDYGTDLEQAYKDILTMNIVDAYAVFNFFKLEFKISLKTLADYSVKMMKDNPDLQKEVSRIMEYYCTLDL